MLDADETALATALSILGRREDSRTARVFAAANAIEGTDVRLQRVVAEYARERSLQYFEPPPAVERDVRRFGRVAREQGHSVDPAAALESAVPDTTGAVLDRAEAIRHSRSLAPRERRQRLDAFLDAARAAGFAVDRSDLDGDGEGATEKGQQTEDEPECDDRQSKPGERTHDTESKESTSENDGRERADDPETAAALTARLQAAETNLLLDGQS